MLWGLCKLKWSSSKDNMRASPHFSLAIIIIIHTIHYGLHRLSNHLLHSSSKIHHNFIHIGGCKLHQINCMELCTNVPFLLFMSPLYIITCMLLNFNWYLTCTVVILIGVFAWQPANTLLVSLLLSIQGFAHHNKSVFRVIVWYNLTLIHIKPLWEHLFN